jgi:hypothetical protein
MVGLLVRRLYPYFENPPLDIHLSLVIERTFRTKIRMPARRTGLTTSRLAQPRFGGCGPSPHIARSSAFLELSPKGGSTRILRLSWSLKLWILRCLILPFHGEIQTVGRGIEISADEV